MIKILENDKYIEIEESEIKISHRRHITYEDDEIKDGDH